MNSFCQAAITFASANKGAGKNRRIRETLASSLILVLAVELIVWFFNRTTLFIGFFIGPACLIYTIAGMSLRIFQIIEKKPGAVMTMDGGEE